jgi:hypothetical protein
MRSRQLAVGTVVALMAAAGATALIRMTAGGTARTLCGQQTAAVAGGSYIVQNNEFSSTARECVRITGRTAFTVARSSINRGPHGAPGGYPSIYRGCHWGTCSQGGLAANPVRVTRLTPGAVRTSWSTAQPSRGIYNVAYDMWFNRTRTTNGQPNCAELMVWLARRGGIHPFGTLRASDAMVGGHSYDVWEGSRRWGVTITYDMTTAAKSVRNLDVGTLAHDAAGRGYLPASCYLISVEAGFEIWRGGAGLTTRSFSVTSR